MLKNVVKNTATYITVAFVGQVIMSLFWVVLSWWLPPSDIGIYSLGMVAINFFSTLCLFSLSSAIGRYYYSEESVQSVFTNTFTLLLGSVTIFLLAFVFSTNILLFFMPGLSDIIPGYLPLFLSAIAASSIAAVCLAHYVTLKKSLIFAVLNFLQTAIFCSLSILLVNAGLGIISLFYALTASFLFIIIYFFVKERSNFKVKTLSLAVMKKLLHFSSPLLFSGVFGLTSYYIAQIFLGKFDSLADLGIYSFFLFFVLQVNGLWSSFNRAWTPEIFSEIQTDGQTKKTEKNIEFMVFATCFLYLSGFVLFVIAGKFSLFNMFLRAEYISSINILYVLLLGPIFSAIFTIVSPLFFHPGKAKYVIFSSVVTTIVNFVLSATLTRFFFVTGAVISFVASNMLMTFLYLIIFRKISNIHKNIIIWTVFLALSLGASCWLLLTDFYFPLFLVIMTGVIITSGWLGRIPDRGRQFFEIYISGFILSKLAKRK